MKTIDPKSLSPSEIFRRLLGGKLCRELESTSPKILVINPGSTSTKVTLFEGLEIRENFEVHIHPDEEDSSESRERMIRLWMEERGIRLEDLMGIAARGGFVRPVKAGTYRVGEEMLEDLKDPEIRHAANMGVKIAMGLRGDCDLPVTITDPVVVDEVELGARLTGIREFKTDGTSAHYLSHKSVLRLCAAEQGLDPEDCDMVSVHLGGGFSLIRHSGGRAVKVINAFSGLPSANRSGSLPQHEVLLRLRDHEISIEDLSRWTIREGGLLSLAGTNDFRTLLEFQKEGASEEQSEKIELVLDFFAEKIAEGILSLCTGPDRPDFACLTGGLSRNEDFCLRIEGKLGGLLPLVRVPGSLEQESLASGMALALLDPASLGDYRKERDSLSRLRARENRLIDRPVFDRPVLRRKKGSPLHNLEEIIQATRQRVQEVFRPTIAIAGADNEDALAAARMATAVGEVKIARFLLVGEEKRTRRIASRLGMDLDSEDFRFIASEDPVAQCLELYEEEACHVLMKGSVKTEEILAPTFRWLKERDRLPENALYSHVAVFERRELGKLILLSDAGINIDPDSEEKRRILENALFVARSLNLPLPRAALLSAVEKVNPRIESSVEAQQIANLYEDRRDCMVEGPLSFDVATEREIAEEKQYPGQIQGNADILIMPGIDSANAVYKTLTTSGHDAAGCIVGGGIPVVLTSRGDSALTKLASISLSLRLYFQRVRESSPPKS
ncbi:MAG: butyrate kinase [Candidatus Krumholzibacteria bacterium]|jgi:phosphate butyryltransferase|nr:butyrate kinase [Candidatus Krumholzibacteria bacterium]